MTNLQTLRFEADYLRTRFQALVTQRFPSMDEWHWSRAISAMSDTPIGRLNDDTSHDASLAADEVLATAHTAYIRALHAFYTARDGTGGFLGGKQ